MAENKTFLSKVNIVAFKGLRNVLLEDLGQFNIILGDNNVGKTSVLESLVFNNSPDKFLTNLGGILYKKQDESKVNPDTNVVSPFFNYSFNERKIQINAWFEGSNKFENFIISSKELSPYLEEQSDSSKQDESQLENSLHTTTLKSGSVEYYVSQSTSVDNAESSKYMPFISAKDLYSDDLLGFYSRAIITSRKKKNELLKNMRSFIPDLEDIEIATKFNGDTPTLITRVSNMDFALPLSMYGDGSIKFFRILLEISISPNTRLMIDEIDSGIHFSRLKSLWRIILNAALANNTQLFITTHNDECLSFLKQVLEEKEFFSFKNKCICYTLKRLPDNSIKPYRYQYENFAFAINQQIELRGGNQ